jgi:hypothetical protein
MNDDATGTVADALGTRPDTLEAFVDGDTAAVEVLGRFGAAPTHLELVEAWLAGEDVEISTEPARNESGSDDDGEDTDIAQEAAAVAGAESAPEESTNTPWTSAADEHPMDVSSEETAGDEGTSDEEGYGTELDGETVAAHYDRVRSVYDALGAVDGRPTMGLDDLAGWYITRDEIDVEPLKEGYTKRRRPASFKRDLDEVLGRVDRTIYALTTYKQDAALRRWTSARLTDENQYEYRGGDNPTPVPEDLRAVSAWGDIDLRDELKPQRGDLDEEPRATAEATLEAYAEEFGQLVGGTDAVYALDSVGGAYIFTAPEATLPIAEYVADEYGEGRAGEVLREVIERSNEWLKQAQQRVEERINGADDVIDPDWANNHNRKYKAPLAIHGDHDAVVTPLDPDDVDYTVTPLDAVDDDLIATAEAWAKEFTAVEFTDRVNPLVAELFADEYEYEAGWQAAIDAYVEELEAAEERQEKREAQREVREERDLDLSGYDITPSIDDVQSAVDRLDIERVADRTIVDQWTERVSGLTDRSGSGKKAIVPIWANGYNSGNATYIDLGQGIFNDTDGGGHGTAVEMALIAEDSWTIGDIANGEDWARGVELLRGLGFDIPVWTPDAEAAEDEEQMPYWALRRAAIALDVVDEDDLVEHEGEDGDTYLGFTAEDYNRSLEAVEEAGLETGREPVSGGGGEREPNRPTVTECAPPVINRGEFDADAHHDRLEGERYDAFVDIHEEGDEQLVLWNDPPGTGKTTSASRAAADRERPHAILFQNHAKALEHRQDSLNPDDYFHIRGAEQKRRDICMEVDHNDADICPEHGLPGTCPSMCPAYDLPKDDATRQLFEALVREVGIRDAHLILGEELPDHDENGKCAWTEEFGTAAESERVVGVHEHLRLECVQSYGDDRRDVIIDESPRALINERDLDIEDLVRMANELAPGGQRYAPTASAALGQFATRLVDVLTGDDAAPDSIAELEPPRISQEVDDLHALPDDVDAEQVESVPVDEALTDDGDGRVRHIAAREPTAEELARAKLGYSERVIGRMKDDEWDGEPVAINALLGAAIEAGLNPETARRAAAGPTTLEGSCPRCRGGLKDADGRRVCAGHEGDEGCGWDESEDDILRSKIGSQRLQVLTGDEVLAPLQLRELPSRTDLPATPLILDATAEGEEITSLFEVSEQKLTIAGDEPLVGNAHITQVLDGQYHAGTIEDTEHVQERMETTARKLNSVHEDLLIIGQRKILQLFDLPASAETLHYGGMRGLNRPDYDAVVCLGAPHPNVGNLRRDAELFAQGQPDIRVGGAEHSTRRDAPNPPVWRKLNFVDDEGQGRAVATKHYSGLVGALFRRARRHELAQAVHRIRPLLAEETKHAYLLTNVPTDLPIDEVCTFNELADPISALVPVDERAVELAKRVHQVASGEGPDGFRAHALVEDGGDGQAEFRVDELHQLASVTGLDVSERTVRRWVEDLVEVGLLVPGEYDFRAGVPYTAELSTLTQALQVLSCNESVEVAIRRRLATLATKSDSAVDWLRRAESLLDLEGDRRDLPPPSVTGG